MPSSELYSTARRPLAPRLALGATLLLAVLPVGVASAATGHGAGAASRCATPHSPSAKRAAAQQRRLRRACVRHAARHGHTTASYPSSDQTSWSRDPWTGPSLSDGPASAARPTANTRRTADGTSTPAGATSIQGAGSLLPVRTGACDNAALSTPFARFGDSNQYKLVPGGDFESSLAGWSVGGGAQVVSGNESFSATGAGTHSLRLPAGASVRTPYTCVDASYPSLRLFARTNSLLATVAVSLEYSNALGLVSVPVGVVTLSPSWQPSLPMLTASAVAGLLSGGNTSVAVRFTALLGDSQIDDVLVDPRMRR